MKKIRKSVFETNSSSTHSICIAKDTELIIPSSIDFSFGEFGWECDTLQSDTDKASYLYTGLIANDRQDDVAKVIGVLESRGVDVIVEEPVYKNERYTDSSGKLVEYRAGVNVGYIDHAYDLNEFLSAICDDEERLMNYLFSPLSFIITGNDNDEMDVDISASYPHEEYYKGN